MMVSMMNVNDEDDVDEDECDGDEDEEEFVDDKEDEEYDEEDEEYESEISNGSGLVNIGQKLKSSSGASSELFDKKKSESLKVRDPLSSKLPSREMQPITLG